MLPGAVWCPESLCDPAEVAQSQKGNEASETRGNAKGELEVPDGCTEIPKETEVWRVFVVNLGTREFLTARSWLQRSCACFCEGKAEGSSWKAVSLGKEPLFVAAP